MKHLCKLMTFAALGALLLLSCEEQKDPTPQKPVVTVSMYSVTANAETGEVVFKFTSDDLSPYWTVVDPSGNKTTFTDREVTKTYTAKGFYTGTLIAYGTGGQSDPAEFNFTIGSSEQEIIDPTLSAAENVLISKTWKLYRYGYYSEEWDEETNAKLASLAIPACAADDRMTFEKDGAFKLDQGADKTVYNDGVVGGIQEGVTVTGNEKWAYVKDGGAEWIQFSDGGFPAMIGDTDGINGRYQIRELTADSFRLYFDQHGQWFFLVIVPESFNENPGTTENGEVTEASAKAALSGKTFKVERFGWWGDGWEYFDDPVPEYTADDTITFESDGSLTIDLGETQHIYNDGVGDGEDYTVEGKGKWAIVKEGGAVKISFSDGGFPLMLAGKSKVSPDDPNYHFGLNAKWTVASLADSLVRVEIYQDFNEQWFTVFLAPAK